MDYLDIASLKYMLFVLVFNDPPPPFEWTIGWTKLFSYYQAVM